ncbi:hypothetical protein A2U01_0077935, partial [Trifolium medium]|nr:hypothetical protein [Trifolium medium]
SDLAAGIAAGNSAAEDPDCKRSHSPPTKSFFLL